VFSRLLAFSSFLEQDREQHFFEFGEGNFDKHGAEEGEEDAEGSDGEIEGKNGFRTEVEVDSFTKGDVLDHHEVEEIGPEGDLADKVEEFGV
jgi:hypothetical protein